MRSRFLQLSKLSILPYLLLTLTLLFWAGNWVVGRAIRNDVPPVALAFWRWSIAFLVLLPFTWGHLRKQWADVRHHWKILTLLSLFSTGTYNAITYKGLQYTTATNGSILNSFVPIFIIAISWLFLNQRLSTRQWVGVALSCIGVLAIIARGRLAALAALEINPGDLWLLASSLMWAIYTICFKWRPQKLHPLAFLAAIVGIGVIIMIPVYLWEMASGLHIHWGPPAIASLVYVGIFPSAIGYIFWNYGVAEIGPNKAGLFLHLMPVFGSLLSIIFLDESFQLYHFFGMALIFAGIYLTSSARNQLVQN